MADYCQVVSDIRTIILSNRGGLPIRKLSRQYELLTGEPTLPYLSLGFNSLFDFIRTLSSTIGTKRNSKDEVVFFIKGKDEKKPPKRRWEKKIHDSQSTKKSNRLQLSYDSGCSSATSAKSWNTQGTRASSQASRNSAKIQFTTKKTLVHEPIVGNSQMIGDDFFLQLVFRNTQYQISRQETNGPLFCGLCESGQTIKSCRAALRKIQSISSKVVIMLGAEDIYKGRTSTEIIASYTNLLSDLETRFGLQRSSITLCSIPPLLNRCFYAHPEQTSVLYSLNSWLSELQNEGYNFIDVFEHFTYGFKTPDFDFFQIDGRNVSGTMSKYVFFNHVGRNRIMALLKKELVN